MVDQKEFSALEAQAPSAGGQRASPADLCGAWQRTGSHQFLSKTAPPFPQFTQEWHFGNSHWILKPCKTPLNGLCFWQNIRKLWAPGGYSRHVAGCLVSLLLPPDVRTSCCHKQRESPPNFQNSPLRGIFLAGRRRRQRPVNTKTNRSFQGERRAKEEGE